MRGFMIGLVIGLAVGVVLAVYLPPDGLNPPGGGGKAMNQARPTLDWKMGSAFPARMAPMGALAKRTAEAITAATGGSVQVELRDPGASVPALDLFDAVSSATIDAAFSSPANWANKAPALQLFAAIPFGPGPQEFLAWFLYGGGRQAYEKLYRRRNIHALPCGVTIPAGGGWFKREVARPAALRGLKVAVSGLAAKVLAKLGARPVLLAAGDIRQALKRGAIDGAVLSVPSADYSLDIHLEAKNYYFPGWQQQAGILELLINLDRWRAISTRQREQIERVCAANLGTSLAQSEAAQFSALKELVMDGVEVRRWPPEMTAALNAAWMEVLAEEVAGNRDFKRIWEELERFREDYAIWRELSYL